MLLLFFVLIELTNAREYELFNSHIQKSAYKKSQQEMNEKLRIIHGPFRHWNNNSDLKEAKLEAFPFDPINGALFG